MNFTRVLCPGIREEASGHKTLTAPCHRGWTEEARGQVTAASPTIPVQDHETARGPQSSPADWGVSAIPDVLAVSGKRPAL